MFDETEELRVALALARLAHANLEAAAYATLAAADEGEADYLYYLRDELNVEGSR